MTINLLKGVIFSANKRPNNTVQWKWGRNNFKTNTNSCVYCVNTLKIFDETYKLLRNVINSKDDDCNKSKDIKDIKKAFLSMIKKYEIRG